MQKVWIDENLIPESKRKSPWDGLPKVLNENIFLVATVEVSEPDEHPNKYKAELCSFQI